MKKRGKVEFFIVYRGPVQKRDSSVRDGRESQDEEGTLSLFLNPPVSSVEDGTEVSPHTVTDGVGGVP